MLTFCFSTLRLVDSTRLCSLKSQQVHSGIGRSADESIGHIKLGTIIEVLIEYEGYFSAFEIREVSGLVSCQSQIIAEVQE